MRIALEVEGCTLLAGHPCMHMRGRCGSGAESEQLVDHRRGRGTTQRKAELTKRLLPCHRRSLSRLAIVPPHSTVTRSTPSASGEVWKLHGHVEYGIVVPMEYGKPENWMDPWCQYDDIARPNEAVLEFYGVPSTNFCQLVGMVEGVDEDEQCEVVSAFVWPEYTKGRGMDLFKLRTSDLFNVMSFLRLHVSIRDASEQKQLIFVQRRNGYSAVVLDHTLKHQRIPGTSLTFEQCNGRQL
jgi:hypothetical protein